MSVFPLFSFMFKVALFQGYYCNLTIVMLLLKDYHGYFSYNSYNSYYINTVTTVTIVTSITTVIIVTTAPVELRYTIELFYQLH